MYVKKVEVLFPIEETIVRSIITYSKLRPSLSLRLLYEPRSQYIANQGGSAKETVSPKIGKNIEMSVCFICMGTQDKILIDIVINYLLLFIYLADKLKCIIHIIQKI